MATKGDFVDVQIEPEFPAGWKKKVYEINGKQMPRWTIWYDNEGNKYVKEEAVRQKLAEIMNSTSKDLKNVNNRGRFVDNRGRFGELSCGICSIRPTQGRLR